MHVTGAIADADGDEAGGLQALGILGDAVRAEDQNSLRFDTRLMAALDWLDEAGGRPPAVTAFRQVLDDTNHVTRRKQMRAAWLRILRAAGVRP